MILFQTYGRDIFISYTRAADVGNLGNTFVTEAYVPGSNVLVYTLKREKKKTVLTEFSVLRMKEHFTEETLLERSLVT